MKEAENLQQQTNSGIAYDRLLANRDFFDDEWQFEQLKFIRKEWLDKDGKGDKFYTLKYVQYEKQIGDEDAAIEVCYGYKTDDGENYKLFETSFDMRIGNEYIKINTDKVYKLRELYRIITGQRLI
jgi:hypothetical protein